MGVLFLQNSSLHSPVVWVNCKCTLKKLKLLQNPVSFSQETTSSAIQCLSFNSACLQFETMYDWCFSERSGRFEKETNARSVVSYSNVRFLEMPDVILKAKIPYAKIPNGLNSQKSDIPES